MDYYNGNDWDIYCFSNNILFIKGLVIVNDYISYDDALLICYCFN